jgi:exosortase C (VPDSG-CTERM-specific)
LFGFAPTLIALVLHVAASQLHSYILLIPFISAYLIYIQWNKLPKSYASSPIPGVVAAGVGLAVAISSWASHWQSYLSENDYLGVMTFSFLCLLVAGGFFFLGRKWMAAVAFPVAFLFFLIPMPDAMVDALENASKLGSTQTANWFFAISGVPYIRQGAVFLLPDITIQVAQECSGIRSSWILLITSLVASYLFLRTPWRRAALVAFVIPLGLLRNGFRILVIGLMCVKLGPGMINSPVHTRGGPIFFVLSLFPLLLFLWWLRRSEQRKKPAE